MVQQNSGRPQVNQNNTYKSPLNPQIYAQVQQGITLGGDAVGEEAEAKWCKKEHFDYINLLIEERIRFLRDFYNYNKYTGYVNGDLITLSFNNVTKVLTITFAGATVFYVNSTEIEKILPESITLPNNNTNKWYVYYDAAGTLNISTTEWLFDGTQLPVCTIFYNPSVVDYMLSPILPQVMMDNPTNETFVESLNAQLGVGYELTLADVSNFVLTGGKYFEGGYKKVYPNFTGATALCRIMYLNTTGNYYDFLPEQAEWTYQVGGVCYYDDGSGTPIAIPDGKYAAMLFFVSLVQNVPVLVMLGRAVYDTLAEARDGATPENTINATALGLVSDSLILAYRGIILNTGGVFSVESVDSYLKGSIYGEAFERIQEHGSLLDRNILGEAHNIDAIYSEVTTNLYVDANAVYDTVNNPPDGTQERPFLTIQDAITASASGDTIIISAGTYAIGTVNIVDKGLTLKGMGNGAINVTGVSLTTNQYLNIIDIGNRNNYFQTTANWQVKIIASNRLLFLNCGISFNEVGGTFISSSSSIALINCVIAYIEGDYLINQTGTSYLHLSNLSFQTLNGKIFITTAVSNAYAYIENCIFPLTSLIAPFTSISLGQVQVILYNCSFLQAGLSLNANNIVFTNTPPSYRPHLIIGCISNMGINCGSGITQILSSNIILLTGTAIEERGINTGEPNGFSLYNTVATTINLANTTGVFTITGNNHLVYIKGYPFYKSTASITIPTLATSGIYWFYYDSTGTLRVSAANTPPSFYGNALIAYCYWNAVTATGILFDERHGITMDWATHKYLHETFGARYIGGFGSTYANPLVIDIDGGSFADEDLVYDYLQQLLCRVWYRLAGLEWTWTAPQNPYIYPDGGGGIYYDNAGALTSVPALNYTKYFIVITNATSTPVASIMGQQVGTLDQMRNYHFADLLLGDFPFQECVAIAEVILDSTAAFVEFEDISTTQIPAGSVVAAFTHNALPGRTTLNSHPARAISYDNATSGLVATAVQAAIDEIVAGTAFVLIENEADLDAAILAGNENLMIGASFSLSGNKVFNNYVNILGAGCTGAGLKREIDFAEFNITFADGATLENIRILCYPDASTGISIISTASIENPLIFNNCIVNFVFVGLIAGDTYVFVNSGANTYLIVNDMNIGYSVGGELYDLVTTFLGSYIKINNMTLIEATGSLPALTKVIFVNNTGGGISFAEKTIIENVTTTGFLLTHVNAIYSSLNSIELKNISGINIYTNTIVTGFIRDIIADEIYLSGGLGLPIAIENVSILTLFTITASGIVNAINVQYGSTISPAAAFIVNCSVSTFINCLFSGGAIIQATSVTDLKFTDCYFGTGAAGLVSIAPAGGVTVANLWFTNCTFYDLTLDSQLAAINYIFITCANIINNFTKIRMALGEPQVQGNISLSRIVNNITLGVPMLLQENLNI